MIANEEFAQWKQTLEQASTQLQNRDVCFMFACVYVLICVPLYVCARLCACVYVRVCVLVCMCAFVCLCVCARLCAFVCMFSFVCVCVVEFGVFALGVLCFSNAHTLSFSSCSC